MAPWTFNEQPYLINSPELIGFVYLITNLTNDWRYIGKKLFTKASYKQINKKRKKIRKDSDWINYWGSNLQLQEDVKRLGEENFKREILHLCKSRGECNYYETRAIFVSDALLREKFYNAWVSCKITRNHLKTLQIF
jgi:hypothetical protein